jgi:RNA polymerase sigma factor (sigma-70 family)
MLHLPENDPIRRELMCWSEQAFNELDRRFRPRLTALLIRRGIPPNDAALLADEALDRLWLPGLCKAEQSEEQIFSWVSTWASWRGGDLKRKPCLLSFEDVRDSEGNTTPGEQLVIDGSQPTPEDLAMARERCEQIDQALASLPELERAVLKLIIQGLKRKAIAVRLGRSVREISKARESALDHMRDRLSASLLSPW